MGATTDLKLIEQILATARRRIFIRAAVSRLVRAGLVILPMAAAAIFALHRWNGGRGSLLLGGVAVGGILAGSVMAALRELGVFVRSAQAVDAHAALKDRISSAYEFLQQDDLGEAQQTQIRDAVRHAQLLDVRSVFRWQWPRFAAGFPLAVLLFALSFFAPPAVSPLSAVPAQDAVKEAQLKMLDELKLDLAAKENLPKEVEDAIRKLEEIKRQFERGEIGERDVMLQLGRLDEALRSKTAELGVENLESEMNAIVPHLAASAATAEAAKAMQEQKLDKAAEALEKLGEKAREGKLSKDEKKKLAAHLGSASSKLGKKKSNDSFSGDLAQATEALEKSDDEGFNSACKSMGQKLGLLSKCKGIKAACNKVGLCKSCLSQCNSRTIAQGPKTLNKNKGGKSAGTAASGEPLGDANRLGDAMKQMVQIAGQAGAGPIETQTEVTEGQMSESQLSAKELHAKYAAAAEEVIEKEDVPLSHRYHVKRYFQAIRPQE